ncbi:MAG: hypothetical protein ACI3XT_07880 [Butyricicoccaceae bacterium]
MPDPRPSEELRDTPPAADGQPAPDTQADDDWDDWDDPEASDRDLREFGFFQKLEQNGGKPTRGLYLSGCFFILPMAALLSVLLFFLLDRLY